MASLTDHTPQLLPLRNAPAIWHDERLAADHGVTVVFTGREGGVSAAPYASLNLAGHVGDAPDHVDRNRTIVLDALGLRACRDRLISAEQVHGESIAQVGEAEAGEGAFAMRGRPPVPETDALVTKEAGIPLLMCFADCVPVVIVAPGPVVAVVHAGWRGSLASLPGKAARRVAEVGGCDISELLAYIGPHIGTCCYEVSDEIISHFVNTFGTLARADFGHLNLEFTVRQSLEDAGVAQWRIASLGTCTADETHAFYSYRAENGTTGRHGALACIGSCP